MFWLNLQHVWVRRTENLQWHIIPKCLSTLLFLCLFWQEKCPISSNSLFCKANVRLLLFVCWITMEACFVCCVPQKLVLTIQRQSILLQAKFSDTSPKKKKPKQNTRVPLWCGVHHSTVWVSHNTQLMRERQHTVKIIWASVQRRYVNASFASTAVQCLYILNENMNTFCQCFLSLRKCVLQTLDTRVCTHTKRVRPTANNKTCLTSPSVLLIAVLRLCCFCELGSLRGY